MTPNADCYSVGAVLKAYKMYDAKPRSRSMASSAVLGYWDIGLRVSRRP